MLSVVAFHHLELPSTPPAFQARSSLAPVSKLLQPESNSIKAICAVSSAPSTSIIPPPCHDGMVYSGFTVLDQLVILLGRLSPLVVHSHV